MKKFLSIIALMLALLMVTAPMIAAEEAEVLLGAVDGAAEEVVEETPAWVAPAGIKTYYATDVSGNAPLLDGYITEGEYGKAYRLENPIPVNNSGATHQEDPVADPTAVSQYIDVYFAYDEDNVYVAIFEMGPEEIEGKDRLVPLRSNWGFNFGFDLNDLQAYFQLQGYKTNVQWSTPGKEFYYFDAGRRQDPFISAYELISEAIIRKYDVKKDGTPDAVEFVGDLQSSNGNENYTDGQAAMVIEFKFEKEVVAHAMNETFMTDYDTISNAMYFGLTTMTYGRNDGDPSQYYKWAGTTDIRGIQGQYSDFNIYEGSSREFMFDLVVFGDENTVIEVADPYPVRPVTEAPTTEPATEAPADETEAPAADETEAPATEAPKAEGGCGSSVAVAGIALVAALGTCTAFVAKKKED